jgi:hypothetical protein
MADARHEDMDRIVAQHMDNARAAVGSPESGWMVFTPVWGKKVWRGSGMPLDEMRKYWAEQMLDLLNTEAWLDGRWFVCWVDFDWGTAAYKRAVLGYQDFDFDVNFVLDIEDSLEDMAECMADYIEQAIEAFGTFKEEMKIRGVTPEEMIKAAKGQPSKDPTADPGLDVLGLRF